MELKTILTDDEAVSPVIGVILMVAITVILAAVIGTFVLGLGDQVQDTSPQASFTFDYTGGTGDVLDITHDGGDSIEENRANVTVSGSASADDTYALDALGVTDGSTVSAGTTMTLNDANTGATDLDLSGATVRVTWNSESGETSATLGKWNGPDA